METVISLIKQYLPLILLGILGVFLLVGLLLGLIRGRKRSLIHCLVVAGFLLVTFLVTPFLGRFVYGLNIDIAGHTPAGWVDYIVEQMQGDSAENYLTPFMPYVKDYLIGLAFAIVNLVLFLTIMILAFVLYLLFCILIKPIIWIICKIVKRIKKKKGEGNEQHEAPRKHRLAGMGIGLLQGLVLFFFVMLPVNGLLNIAGAVADYQSHSTSAQVQTTSENDFTDVIVAVGEASTPYRMAMRYTGLEFLTDRSFEYQTTARVQGTNIVLREDIKSVGEIAVDFKTYQNMMDRINTASNAEGNNAVRGLSALTAEDYQVIHNLADKVLHLQVLKVGDAVLANLDEILSTCYSKNNDYLPGTEIVENSFYGLMIKSMAQDDKRAEYAEALKSVVKYIEDKKLNLVRDDLLAVLDIMQQMYTTEIAFPDAEHKQPIMMALTTSGLNPVDYLNILLCEIDNDKTPLDLIYDDILSLSTMQMLAQPHAENLLAYTRVFNDLDKSTGMTGMEVFVREFSSMFLGTDAFAKNGAWDTLHHMLKSVMDTARDYITIVDDINALSDDIRAAGKVDEDKVMPQAIMQYLSNLLDKTEGITEDEKYAKVDKLANCLNEIVCTFEPVTKFLKGQVGNLGLGDFGSIFTELLNTSSAETWRSTFRSVVGITDLLANNEILQDITSIDFNDEKAVQQLVENLAEVEPGELSNLVYDLLEADSVGNVFDETLQNMDFGYEEGSESAQKVEELKDFLNTTMADESKTEAEKRAMLESIIAGLLGTVENV